MTAIDELSTGEDLARTTAGTLLISGGAANLVISGAARPDRLYDAKFRTLVPTVTSDHGTVAVHYPRRPHPFTTDRGEGRIELSPSLPWFIRVSDSAANLTADLTALTLTGLKFDGSVVDVVVDLPRPAGAVTIRIHGSARNVNLRRPTGVAITVHIGGGAAHLHLDGEVIGAVAHGYRSTQLAGSDHYAVVIDGAVDGLTVTN